MNYEATTGKSIQTAFEEFHNANPQVYSHFKRLALQAINKGKKKISIKMIGNVIRWEIYIATVDPDLFNVDGKEKRFKLNDAYFSRYARLFVSDYPEHSNKIELRTLRSN